MNAGDFRVSFYSWLTQIYPVIRGTSIEEREDGIQRMVIPVSSSIALWIGYKKLPYFGTQGYTVLIQY